MPTNRKRRSRKFKPQSIPPALLKYFRGEAYGAGDEGACDVFLMELRPAMAEAWESYRDQVIADWIKKNPCTRPWAWWTYDAAKEPVNGWDHERFNSAQRRRLGGVGTPSCDVTCARSGFDKGIPAGWVDQWQVDYYNGRAKDIHGNPIGTKFKEGDFEGVAIDPKNPPVFESVAAYLKRHDLLTPAERTYLKKHRELMEPEKFDFEDEEE